MKYRLIVFDWDGTIMDSTGLIAECIQLAAADCNLPTPSLEAAKHIIGLGIVDSTRHLFPALNDDGIALFAARYRTHYLPRDNEVRLYAGIEDVLLSLAHEARFLAVATGKPRKGLNRAFQYCGLAHHFHYTRCADEGFAKPHPDMLEKLMSYTGVSANETLMIGDTTHDLEMAFAAGCAGLGVSYGAHTLNKLLSTPSIAVVDDVEALKAWLILNG
jgi:phosphoglycolate phosphatase